MNDPFAQYHGNPLDDLRRIARQLARAKRGLLIAAGLDDGQPDKQELLRQAAQRTVTMMVKQPPSVHRVPQDLSKGMVGETTIEDRGAEFRPVGADVSTVDGVEVPFWDVSKGPSVALVATREGLAAWLSENGLCGLVNSDTAASSGADIHTLMVDTPVQISAVASWFDPITEKDRYHVINPFAQYLKLLGGRAASAVATPLQGTFGAENAEGLRAAAELVNPTVESAEGARELLGEGEEHSGATGVYLVEFFAVAGMSSDKGRFVTRAWTSADNPPKGRSVTLGGNWAWLIPIADITGDILNLVDSL